MASAVRAKREKEVFERVLQRENITQTVTLNRQHYFRLEASTTSELLEDAGYIIDSQADTATFQVVA